MDRKTLELMGELNGSDLNRERMADMVALTAHIPTDRKRSGRRGDRLVKPRGQKERIRKQIWTRDKRQALDARTVKAADLALAEQIYNEGRIAAIRAATGGTKKERRAAEKAARLAAKQAG